MDNSNTSHELEEMRQQLILLNHKLDNEKIVNQKLIRSIMSTKISKLVSSQRKLLLLAGLLALPIVAYILLKLLYCSLSFVVVTALFLVIASVYGLYTQHGINGSELINGNLLNVSRKLIRYRSLGNKWFFFAVPFMMVWLPWFFMQMLQQSDAQPAIIGGIVGVAIGGLMGFRYYRKSQATIKEVLNQIDDLTKEE